MGRVDVYHHTFSTGVVDRGILPRTDLQVMQFAAEEQTNLLCLATGRGFLRPGFEYLGSNANGRARLKEFVFSASDACILEFTDGAMRVWVDDELVTRAAVTSTITSGDFSASTGWTNASTDGATASVASGYLNLTAGAKGSLAVYKQQVTTSSPGAEHALRIVVQRGPVTFRCGSTDGGDDYIAETQLRTGVHSLAFTPSGSYWVQFEGADPVLRLVDSIQVESAGTLSLPTPWGTDDIDLIRTAQSADVVFVACRGLQQRRIERRGIRGAGRSWSIVLYSPDNGPFTVGRTARVRLKPSVTEGNGTLEADKAFFKPEHVGALFRLNQTGQYVNQTLAGESQFTDAIEVTGINNSAASAAADQFDERQWTWAISGTWSGTLKVQRSFDGPDFGFKAYRATSAAATIDITTNGTGNNTDTDNNAQVWYRIGFEEGDYTSGAAVVALGYDGGGGSGVCRVVGYTSETEVDIEILSPFSNTSYTDDWQEGQWSDHLAYPSSVALFEGRLWWAGSDRFWGSVSDDFENFDEEFEGDAGPINRVVATNGVNDTQWMMPLQRLVLGTEGTETTARSSSFDEPLTPTNTTLKDASTVGSAAIEPARVDGRGLFVDRSGKSLFELVIDAESVDYAASEITKLVKDRFAAGVRGMAVQRRPDTRIWCWLTDGTAVCLVYEPKEQVAAFIPIETDGDIEGMAVLPGDAQDRVYAGIARVVDGSTVRYFERMASDAESRPGTVCKVMDSAITFANAPASATVSGLSHLVGESVVVWADGTPLTEEVDGATVARTFVVSASGTITLPAAATTGAVGLPYAWQYKSARLAYGASGGTSMIKEKRLSELGLILTDYARAGIRYGGTFDESVRPMDPLPVQRDHATAPSIVTGDVDDESHITFNQGFDLDSRLCLKGGSPFPASLLGLTLAITTNG